MTAQIKMGTARRRFRRAPMVLGVSAVSTVLALALGCATTGINQGQINLVSVSEEWKMGQQLEQELGRRLRLVNDPTALSHLNGIGQRLVKQTEMASFPWEFHIVADPDVNAFNIPGGHVYVNTGLIMAADNAPELAGVLAHEIAHGTARHATERLTAVYGLNIGTSLLLGQNPSQVKQIAAQIAAGGAVAKYTRAAEREADRLGVQYMHRAGYDPEGMATMFEELLAARKSRPGAVQQFFATHPLAEDRIRSVRQQAQSLPRRSYLAGDAGLSSLKQRVRRYGG